MTCPRTCSRRGSTVLPVRGLSRTVSTSRHSFLAPPHRSRRAHDRGRLPQAHRRRQFVSPRGGSGRSGRCGNRGADGGRTAGARSWRLVGCEVAGAFEQALAESETAEGSTASVRRWRTSRRHRAAPARRPGELFAAGGRPADRHRWFLRASFRRLHGNFAAMAARAAWRRTPSRNRPTARRRPASEQPRRGGSLHESGWMDAAQGIFSLAAAGSSRRRSRRAGRSLVGRPRRRPTRDPGEWAFSTRRWRPLPAESSSSLPCRTSQVETLHAARLRTRCRSRAGRAMATGDRGFLATARLSAALSLLSRDPWRPSWVATGRWDAGRAGALAGPRRVQRLRACHARARAHPARRASSPPGPSRGRVAGCSRDTQKHPARAAAQPSISGCSTGRRPSPAATLERASGADRRLVAACRSVAVAARRRPPGTRSGRACGGRRRLACAACAPSRPDDPRGRARPLAARACPPGCGRRRHRRARAGAPSWYSTLELPYEAARARIELAGALAETSPQVALGEAIVVLAAFDRIGAGKCRPPAADLVRRLGGGTRPGPRRDATLTARGARGLRIAGVRADQSSDRRAPL